jgi:hypothetical protein
LWPTGFVDNVTEPFPRDLDDPIWLGIQKFVDGSFAYAELYTAAGTLVTSGYVDADGCLNGPQDLGAGNYYLRIFTELAHDGMDFRIDRQEEVGATGTAKVLSLTLSTFVRNPGARILMANQYWSNETNAAATAGLALRKDADGIDLGLTRNTANPVVYPFRINVSSPSSSVGAYYLAENRDLHLNPSFAEWTHTARWKFVIGHEFGHMIQDRAGVGLENPYFFLPGTNTIANGISDPDPVSAAALAACNCSLVDHPLYSGHCLQSMEVSESAQGEAFGHFIGARLWNYTPEDDDYDGTCSFSYYKRTSADNLLGDDDGIPVVPVNCAMAYGHRDAGRPRASLPASTRAT